MRIWWGYGSEHSMNLVMIGRFKDARHADDAKQAIERLTEQVNADVDAGLMEIGQPLDRFSEGMLKLLREVKTYSLGPGELDQFGYDVSVALEDDARIVVTTDEYDVSAFLKVLLDKGARIEVFSAHDYPGTGHGRGG